jgi:quercetin dioxygenase-like cupin family protein
MLDTFKIATLAATLGAMLPLAATACESTHLGEALIRVAAEADADVGTHLMVEPGELAWTPGPGSLPRGVEFVTIEGDPSKAGPFTMRLKFRAGYRIPAHSHPAIEHITVLSGVFGIGVGDELDTSKGRAMPAGSFVVMPVGHNHFAWTEEETVVQLHGIGPWGITYVDPIDDPRGY